MRYTCIHTYTKQIRLEYELIVMRLLPEIVTNRQDEQSTLRKKIFPFFARIRIQVFFPELYQFSSAFNITFTKAYLHTFEIELIVG